MVNEGHSTMVGEAASLETVRTREWIIKRLLWKCSTVNGLLIIIVLFSSFDFVFLRLSQ